MSDTWLRRSRRASFLAVAALVGSLTLPAVGAYAATAYYVNCSASSNGSGSSSSPWNTLSSVNSHTFGAGDTINFVSGTTCRGQLTPKGSGSSSSPITINRTGSGAMPIINGNGATGPVIHLVNQQYWNISNLELTNSASSAAFRSGILADNSSGGVLHHIHVSGMDIHNISGWAGGWYATNAGVGIQTFHTSSVSTWDDIQVTNNVFANVDRIAVAVTDDTDGQGTGQTTGVQITGNTITNSGGDDILVVHGSGALIEHNTASGGGSRSRNACPPNGQYCNGASAGIWIAGSNDSVIAYNESSCEHNVSDGMGFDVDWGNHNATVEYNYSHQNGGGFLLVMPPDSSFTSEPWAVQGSYGVVARDNISVNDGVTTGCPTVTGHDVNQGIVTFGGQIPNVSGEPIPTFYNNSFYLPSSQSTPVVYSRAGSSPHGSYVFDNNIVENHGSGGYITTTGSTFSHNVMYGNHPATEPADSSKITSNPLFADAGGLSSSNYKLQSGSPARSNGLVIANNGGTDFFGNPVSASAAPNRGADNGGTGGGGGSSKVVNRNSGLCLGVAGSSTSTGGLIDQETCSGATNQQWTFSGKTLVNVHSGLCLDVPGGTSMEGTQLDQWTCNSGSNQNFAQSSSGGYTTFTDGSNQLVEVSGKSQSNGAAVDQWPSNGGSNQQWTISAS